jgi:DNA-directed RNA polymerase subunit RPC12/RpoP
MPFPSSTCVECGRTIPGGQMQKCRLTVGGYCSHRVPFALRDYLVDAELIMRLATGGHLQGVKQ